MKRSKTFLSILVIIIVTSFSFYNSIDNDFVNWDDDVIVINNDDIKEFKAENIKAFFSNYYIGHYHPFTVMSLAFDYKIGELSPKVYHIHNIILHIISSIILLFIFFHFFRRYDISLLLVLIFAVHPLKVESVSWIAERKDVLYSFYYLAAILSYLNYLKRDGKLKYLILTFCLFVFSLLSKTAAVSLPVILLLIDYYYKRTYKWRPIIEKVPFLILSLLFGIYTVYVLDSVDAIYDITDKYSIFDRILLPFYSICFYLLKFIAPVNLSASYFFVDKINAHLPYIYYIAPIIILGLGFLVYKIRILKREIIFGFLFFLVTIFLFLQILPSGRVIVADRYAYIPYIGIIFIIGNFYVYFLNKRSKLKKTNVFTYILIVFIAVNVFLTRERNKIWANGESLFTDLVEKFPNNELGYVNRGIAKYYGFTKNNKIDYLSAINDFNKALTIDSLSEKAIFNRGNSYYNTNQISKALADFNKVLDINPKHAKALNNRGLVYSLMKEDQKALSDYNLALQIAPEYGDAYLNRGIVFFNTNKIEDACKDWHVAKKFKSERANELIMNYCK